MIAYLEGVVISVGGNWLVVKVGGVGYKVFPIGFFAEIGDDVSLHIVDYIREDRRELYASKDSSVLDIFEKLIDISGVGPKLAQKILSAGDTEKMKEMITKGDIGFLTSISGVGKKTAQKIVLELKGVLTSVDDSPEDTDTLEALMSLGYQRKDCAEIIKHLKAETPEERIREALQMFSNQ